VKQATLKLLFLIFIPVVFVIIFAQIVWGLVLRFKTIFVKSKPDVISLNTSVNSNFSNNSKLHSILPVPSADNYLGDIIGYFKYVARGGPNSLGNSQN